MNDDLRALLTQAENSIEQSIAAADAPLLRRLTDAARRRRLARHTRRAVVGAIAAAAVTAGIVAWPGLGHDTPRPALTPDPSPTVTTSPSPSPTPPPTDDTPAVPPTRAEHIDDATVIARLSNPRTGETWTTPEPAPEILPLLGQASVGLTAFRVGQRGDAAIYVTVDTTEVDLGREDRGAAVRGLFEVDPEGTREILCPTARSTAPCSAGSPTPAVTADSSTFYDTLTVPHQLTVGDGFTLSTAAAAAWTTGPSTDLVNGSALVGAADELQVMRSFGALKVVQLENRDLAATTGLTSVTYALLTPFGATLRLGSADVPGGDFAAIVWDDGIVRPTVSASGGRASVAAGSPFCAGADFSVEDRHAAQDWRAAGTTPDGQRVHVPVTADVPISRTLRAWHEEGSATVDRVTGEWVTGAAAGYPYATDLAFHDAHALFAIEGPSGEWQLRLRPDAASVTWECT